MQIRTWAFTIALGIALVAAGEIASAATLANFDGGNGTATPDQFTGTAGNGWAGAWTGPNTSSTVTAANPLNGGGNYLSSGGTASGVRNVYRQFNSPMANQPHVVSWQWRFDGNFSQFASENDRVQFFGDSAAGGSSGASNSWLIGVTANRPGFGAVNGEFYIFDGTSGSAFDVANMFDTNLVLQDDTIYDFEVIVDPASATYSATISDGVNTVSATGLGFRNGTAGAYDFLGFGVNASATNDDLTFALDSISVTAVPEPGSLALWTLLGFVAVGLAWRRRRG